MNQKMLLSPNNILLLHPTSGSIPEKSLVPHLRLAAKLLVLEWHLPAPSLGKSSETDRGSCLAPVKQARLLPGGTYTLKTAGCWYSNNRGLVLHDSLLLAVDTLHGAVITVVIVKNFIEAVRVGPQGQFLVGYLGKVVNALATSLGFRFIIMDGSSFGSKTINGSYDGVVGHIERKEGDLGLASLSINYNRYQAIDYTSWLEYHPTLFLTRGPRYLKDPLGVFKLYTWQAWSAIAAFLIFSASFLWLFWSCGPSSGYRLCPSVSQGQGEETLSSQYENRQHMEDETVSFFSVLTTILKAIVFQGSCHPPRSSTGRLVYVCMWMVVIIVFGVYSGNLTAFLSLPVLSMPPTTIRQLVIRDWTIKLDKAYGSHDLVKARHQEIIHWTIFNRSWTKPQQRRAEERGTILENVGATSTSKTNLDELLQMDIAIVMGVTGAYYMMNVNQGPDKRCILASSQEAMAKEYAALAVPKRSLLKPIFDNKLRWMRQMGVIHKYYEDSFGVKCHREKTTSSEPAAMTLNQLLGVFYVWTGGVAVSCCIFLCELCFGGKMKGTN
ncbi:Ionotropic receptor 25a-like 2 [Homarus americanus]|uniref:Ionotropic receptor 25a-like 2 n=1 Tax=Homarus americanus TaxID=6706 RepID=A0A8J5N3M2_HOMAM|nr:Ionotropic receptor 25a-like 2 [Homarus americanus]